MRKSIELTPEWVLEKIPHTHYADGDGKISVYTNDAVHASLIELALETLQLSFQTSDFFDDENEVTIEFNFGVEDINGLCPNYYRKMKELNKNNRKHKKNLKNN